MRKIKAQSLAEYALLVSLMVASVAAMQVYVKRGLQARYKTGADYPFSYLDEQQKAINGTSVVLENLPRGVIFPDPLKDKIQYGGGEEGNLLTFLGVMTEGEKGTLLSLSYEPSYQAAIEELFQKTQQCIYSRKQYEPGYFSQSMTAENESQVRELVRPDGSREKHIDEAPFRRTERRGTQTIR